MRPAPAAEDYSQKPFATPEDRLHFCSYEQAYAAIPDEIPQHGSSGHRWVAVNLSTGHSIPCADLLIATGYVAGSSVLMPQWRFALAAGPSRWTDIAAHPRFKDRLARPDWRSVEEDERQAKERARQRQAYAQQAYERALHDGPPADEW